MKKLILSSFALVAFVFASNSAFAQPFTKPEVAKTATTALGVSISTVMDLDAVSAILSLPFMTAKDLTQGLTTAGDAVTLTYKSNWKTSISISASDFVSAGNPSLTMPASIISFNTTGGIGAGDFTSSLASSQILQAGILPTAAGDVIKLTYKVTPTLIYAPASDYSSTITYTISAD